jgi:hypothetical protein
MKRLIYTPGKFVNGIRFTVNSWYKETMKVWKEKKKAGIRCRKPG